MENNETFQLTPQLKEKRETADILLGMIQEYDLKHYPDIYTPEKIKERFKEMISQWHDEIKPEYIFLNETSATPFGYLFKESWEKAYPGEAVPKFYRVDPRSLYFDNPEEFEVFKDYFFKRIKDRTAKVIVFDETGPTGGSVTKVKRALGGVPPVVGPQLFAGRYPENEESWKDYMKNIGIPEENIFIYRGIMKLEPDTTGSEWQAGQKGMEVWPEAKVTRKTTSYDRKSDEKWEKRFNSRRIKDPEEREKALRYISELKSVGQEIGEEIARAREQI